MFFGIGYLNEQKKPSRPSPRGFMTSTEKSIIALTYSGIVFRLPVNQEKTLIALRGATPDSINLIGKYTKVSRLNGMDNARYND
jgi:hypothetical protein